MPCSVRCRAELPIKDLPAGRQLDCWLPVSKPEEEAARAHRHEPAAVGRHGGVAQPVMEAGKEAALEAKQALHGRHRKQCCLHLKVSRSVRGAALAVQAPRGP